MPNRIPLSQMPSSIPLPSRPEDITPEIAAVILSGARCEQALRRVVQLGYDGLMTNTIHSTPTLEADNGARDIA